MKRLFCCLCVCALLVGLTACGAMTISDKMYGEISNYVTENIDNISPTEDTVFYEYTTKGLSVGGVYYGYYYSSLDEVLLPDFYTGDDLESISANPYEKDGGIYFGKPNDGTDWCFIKRISDNWFYYELHW